MSTTFCNIILHVAGDIPLSPTIPPNAFTPTLALASPLLPPSPAFVCLSDLLSGPAEFPSNASLLPADTFLQPPRGILRRQKIKERKWFRGTRLHPAWTKIPGDASDQFILVPVEFPELMIEDRDLRGSRRHGICARTWFDVEPDLRSSSYAHGSDYRVPGYVFAGGSVGLLGLVDAFVGLVLLLFRSASRCLDMNSFLSL
ncbi:hypothetical protein C8Q74DRAFT_1244250 [Fomes fomentarius]|nr:hypothetical protein C8Q74DRAFT_1244250 [Fomes fomentarius]